MQRPSRRLATAASLLIAVQAAAFDAEYYEIPAGMSFSIQVNPKDDVYGLNVEDATWLTDTPVLGQLFLSLLSNGIEDAWYAGIGMMFRLMPHSELAPFVGAGASYNQLVGDRSEDDDWMDETSESDSKAESYWGGHAEAGLRFWFAGQTEYIELYGRQTWTSENGDHDYWVAGLSYGQNF